MARESGGNWPASGRNGPPLRVRKSLSTKWSTRGRRYCFWRWRFCSPLPPLFLDYCGFGFRRAGRRPTAFDPGRYPLSSVTSRPPKGVRCSASAWVPVSLTWKMLFSEKVYSPGLVQESLIVLRRAFFFCGGQKIPSRSVTLLFWRDWALLSHLIVVTV